jgi:hypothetical protein
MHARSIPAAGLPPQVLRVIMRDVPVAGPGRLPVGLSSGLWEASRVTVFGMVDRLS